jgi:hypothetical protein
MAGLRRKNIVASRRRVDDEGEEEGGPDTLELEDDSLSEGSVLSDEDDLADGSELSQVDTHSPTSPDLRKSGTNGHAEPMNGHAKSATEQSSAMKLDHPSTQINGINDTEMMLNGLHISDHNNNVEEVHYDDLQEELEGSKIVEQSSALNSIAQMDQPQETPLERRRREHEEYKSKRDADPAFVPNRGAFFMHDHRHAGPAANGFRPFGRGRGRGKTSIGGPFAPIK